MTLGTRLTIPDYLGTNKSNDVWGQQSLEKNVELPSENQFGSVLSGCLSGQHKSGLTASDYLENPVTPKPGMFLNLSDYMQPGRFEEKGTLLSRIQARAASEVSPEPFENTEDNCTRKDIENSIKKASKKYDLPESLIRGIVKAESDFQVRAESPAGAQGLMQLMPATAQELGVTDPFDIDQNIDAGTRYLKNMMNRFENDPNKALAAYNAGPGTVERYGGKVPYQETINYVARVLDFAGMTV